MVQYDESKHYNSIELLLLSLIINIWCRWNHSIHSQLTFVFEHAISTSTFDMMLLSNFQIDNLCFCETFGIPFVVHSLKSIFLFESQTYCKQNKSNWFVLKKVLSFKQLWNSHDNIPFFSQFSSEIWDY